MRDPRRHCAACGTELPGGHDPTDDLCDDCGWQGAQLDDESDTVEGAGADV